MTKEEIIISVKKNLHIFETNYKFYLFDIHNFVRMQISERLYELVKNIILDNEESNELYIKELNALEILYNNNILTNNEHKDVEINAGNRAYLSFAPIYNCNFKCRYCFGEAGSVYDDNKKDFSEALVENTLNYFFYDLFPEASSYRIDFVSGGEPLLNFQAIKSTVDFVEKFQSDTGKRVVIWLCTNGSLINNSLCSYLDSHNITIGLSLDGIKEKHDCNRIDIVGNPTYDLVINKFKMIKTSENLSEKFKNIWVLTVLTPDNYNLVEIIKHHYNLGLNSVQMKLIRGKKIRNTFYLKLQKEYKKLASFLFEQYIKYKDEYLYMILNDYDYFGKILKRILINQKWNYRCLASKRKVTICPNGDIYPCDSFVGINKMVIGNIYNNRKLSKNTFLNCNVENRDKCNTCSIRYICGGDCYYNSYLLTDDVCGCDDNICMIMKSICNCAIWLSCEMEMYDKKHFNSIVKRLQIKEQYITV